MKCPRCESRQLWIFVRFSGYVLCESSFDDDVAISESASMSSDWDDDSPCRCHSCQWTGSVGEVRELGSLRGTSVRTRPAVTSLAEVKHRLKAQPCPVIWSDCIRYLMSQLEASEERIRRQDELLKKQKNRGAESDDTQIM